MSRASTCLDMNTCSPANLTKSWFLQTPSQNRNGNSHDALNAKWVGEHQKTHNFMHSWSRTEPKFNKYFKNLFRVFPSRIRKRKKPPLRLLYSSLQSLPLLRDVREQENSIINIILKVSTSPVPEFITFPVLFVCDGAFSGWNQPEQYRSMVKLRRSFFLLLRFSCCFFYHPDLELGKSLFRPSRFSSSNLSSASRYPGIEDVL